MKVEVEAVKVEEADLILRERIEWMDRAYTDIAINNLGCWLLGLDSPTDIQGERMKTVDDVLYMLPEVQEPLTDRQRKMLRATLAQVPQEALDRFTPETVICVHQSLLDFVGVDIPWIVGHDSEDTDKVFILFDGPEVEPTRH